MRRFFHELRRRHLIGALSAYAIVAWVVVQAASIALPAFDAPPWAMRLVILAAIAGAPVVFVVAWVFDLTPRGLVRTDELPDESAAPAAEPARKAEPEVAPPPPADVRAPSLEIGPERRQVTILYAGVAVLAADDEELDPEVEREIVPLVRVACEQAAEAWGGTPGSAAGNDFARYYGVPTANEDDALRAVRAGLAMQQAVAPLNARWQSRRVHADLRVTIHTGTVVAEDPNAAAGRPPTLSGDAVKVPAAIQYLTGSGEVTITAATYRLVDDLVEGEERSMAAVGLRGGEQLYRITRVADVRARGAALAGMAFVGRDREQALLEERWGRARRSTLDGGEGQAVLVSGEPGIGKSRIVQRLIEFAGADAGSRIVIGQCSPYHVQRSLFPVATLLERDLMGFDPEGDEAEKARQLEQFLVAAGIDPAQSMPLFGALLGVPSPYPPLQLAPDRQQQLLLEQIASLLVDRAEIAPTLVVVEDLHWADAATLELLTLLLDQLSTARILLLLTFRPEFEPAWPLRSNMLRLPMSRLDGLAAAEIVAKVAAPQVVPPRVIQRIVERADGVPLFVEELTRAVLESGSLARAGEDDDIPIAIPQTLQESLAARLDRLGPAKRVAQIAATIGREFSYALLAAVAGLDEPALERVLDELVHGEFILRKGIGRRARFLFKHALIQDAAYGSLLKSKRREYHGRIAEALEQHFPELRESQPELLALHFREAGLSEPAVRYGIAAGRAAARRSANTEAEYYFEGALESLAETPPGTERDRRELGLQMALMPVLVATKGYGAENLERTCSRALALCDAVGDVPEKVFALFGLWMFHVVRANHAQSLELAQRFDEFALASGSDDLQVEADLISGIAPFFVGRLDESTRRFEACLERYDPARHADHAFRYGQDPRVIACSYLSWIHWLRGDEERSLAISTRAVEASRALDHPLTLSFALTFAAWLHAYRGDLDAARRYADETAALCTEFGIQVFLAHARVVQAWCDCGASNDRAHRQALLDRIDDFLALGARCFVPLWESHVAEAQLDGGGLGECAALLERMARNVAATGETWAQAEFHRVRARWLRAMQAAPEAVEAEFVLGEQEARTIGSREWERRIAHSRAP